VRRPVRWALPIVTLLLAVAATAVPAQPGRAAAVAPPAHALSVTGDGVGSYPAFDPAVERYAVTTTTATGGAVTVHASTSDPAGVVRVDGRVVPGGTTAVSGLAAGDEISVIFEDSAGTEVHSLIYLPAGFPALEAVATSPDVAQGQIGLTLFALDPQMPRFATTVDRNGVPTHVEQVADSLDLKQQPNGTITLTEPTTTPERTGSAIVVRDDHWQETARYETVGLTNTDPHDSILLPDGSRFLMAYEPNAETGMLDAVIQEIDASGQVVFDWSSEGLEDESARPSTDPDYAHVNSVQLVGPDRDIVVSFRHLSSVFRIATRAHGSYQPEDIVWKLGGRHSDFTFVNDPYDGPCAQHTASVLANGNVLVFDDGSGAPFAPALCIDPADADGDPVTRIQSRAVEYAIDPVQGTATQVWDYTPSGRYAPFMGSTARLGNGDTLIGWGASQQALASEVAADSTLLWELRAAPGSPPYMSYRASLMNVRDAFEPEVAVTAPSQGVHYALGQQVSADFSCTDVGGSSLQTCAGEIRPGGLLDTTTPGPHTVQMVAKDGAGNTTAVTRTYTVDATYQPRWTDDRVRTSLRGKRVTTKVTVVNAGTYADTFALLGTGGSPRVDVRYKVGRTDVTAQVRRGLLRTPLLQPGQSFVLRVVAVRTDRTRPGAHRTFRVSATSLANQSRAVVMVAVRAR
jgi:hypothetical protein